MSAPSVGPVGPDPVVVADVAENLTVVRRRIRAAGGDPDRITILAVTKGFGPEVAAAALAAGLVDLGENYAQDLAAKARGLAGPEPGAAVDPGRRGGGPAPRWHMIGRVQSNKVALLAPHVNLWQTLDRPTLADDIARRAPGAAVLVQVNAGREPQKAGVEPDGPSVGALVAHARAAGLDVQGLMAVGVAGDDGATREAFRRTRGLVDELGLAVCSMGMTADLEVAVEEGSTLVRVGRQLFGPRPPR